MTTHKVGGGSGRQTNNEPQDFDDMVFHNMVGWRDRSNRIEIERDALHAENARLREALAALLDDAEVQDFGEWLEARMKQARAALEEKS